jgi:hypothetical protein
MTTASEIEGWAVGLYAVAQRIAPRFGRAEPAIRAVAEHRAASSIIVAGSALRFFFTVTLKRLWIAKDDSPPAVRRKSFRSC